MGDDVAWFRLTHPVVDGAGPLSSLLGPADWTHGITRPLQDVVADPNPNLTVTTPQSLQDTGFGQISASTVSNYARRLQLSLRYVF